MNGMQYVEFQLIINEILGSVSNRGPFHLI